MPPVQLPFPVTALPGRRPGEGQGDLINCYARRVGDLIRWQRVPGTRRFTPPLLGPSFTTFTPRGQIAVDNYLVSVWGDKATRTVANGTTQTLAGVPIAGTGPVCLARNMRSPPDVVAVTAGGDAYWLDLTAGVNGTVKDYPVSTENGSSIEPVNSVDYFSGYFIFSKPNATIIASDLQTMQWKALSFAKAEASPDGLLRVFAAQPTLLACGPETIEVYQDVGASPFPLQRVTVLPVGLLGTYAIAGGAKAWDRPVVFVANDATVRQLKGYDPVIISNEDVVSDIEAAASAGLAESLYAQVYTNGDNAIWSLSSPTWTWEHNLSTTSWHRRRSYQPGAQHADAPVPWRGYFTAKFGHRWITQDALDGGHIEVTSEALNEPPLIRANPIIPGDMVDLPAPLLVRCESGPVKDVPANIRMSAIYLDFTVGFQVPGVPDPAVFLSWSHDGGATWSNPLERRLGSRGEYRTLVTLRSTGRSSHQGMRLRWECADPVPVAFHSAVAPRVTASRPRQVDIVLPGGAVGD
jgi:hypothetical protein